MYFAWLSFLNILVLLTGVLHTNTNHSCLLVAFYTVYILYILKRFYPAKIRSCLYTLNRINKFSPRYLCMEAPVHRIFNALVTQEIIRANIGHSLTRSITFLPKFYDKQQTFRCLKIKTATWPKTIILLFEINVTMNHFCTRETSYTT